MSGNPYWNLPFPAYYPVKTNESGYNYNPAGSIPRPVSKPYTVPGLWVGAKVPLQGLFANGTQPVLRTVTWSTPVFDLRPELHAATGEAPNNAVPVWRQLYGVGGKLWVQITNFDSAIDTKTGLRLTSTEFGHIVDPDAMAQIDDPEDITSEFVGPAPSGIVAFTPPGAGYPVRFWRLQVTVAYLLAHPDPAITLQGAYY